MRRLILAFPVSAALAATLSMPDWLAPYPGSKPNTQTYDGVVESSYVTVAKPAAIVAHYQKEFDAAQVAADVNDDGQGVAMRGAAAECDLLIRVRQQGAGSLVSVSCSGKSSAAPQATYLPDPASTRRSSLPQSPRDPEQMRAAAKARQEQAFARMKNYDQPVYPEQQTNTPLVLQWPSWLVHMPSADHGLQVVRSKYVSGLAYLSSTYKTSAPMTSIRDFYADLLRANGYTVVASRVATGSTSTHVQQNADGSVEGRLLPNGIGNGSIDIRVEFSRMFLNEPITVTLNVTARPPVR